MISAPPIWRLKPPRVLFWQPAKIWSNVEQQVLLRAVQAFMSVRRAIAFVDLAQNNERVITTELRAARDRFEVGEVTRTDVSIAGIPAGGG